VRGGGSLPTFPSDVYSFASVVFEILTETPPFAHLLSGVDVILAINRGERPPRPLVDHPATTNGLDDEMWGLLQRCWNQKPTDRPTMATVKDSFASRYLQETLHAIAHIGTSIEVKEVKRDSRL